MVPVRRDFTHYILIGAINLESDDWEDLTFTIEANNSNSAGMAIDVLDETGTLVPVEYTVIKQTQDNLTFRLERPTKALDFTLLRIRNN